MSVSDLNKLSKSELYRVIGQIAPAIGAISRKLDIAKTTIKTTECISLHIYFKNNLFGYLNNANRNAIYEKSVRPYYIDANEAVNDHGYELVKTLRFEIPIQIRQIVIDKRDLQDSRYGSVGVYNIPDYADQFEDPMRDAIRFVWKVGVLTSVDDLEQVFDHPDFIPA